MTEEKNLKEKVLLIKKNDPFLDPDHANDNAAVDTDIREQMDHETIEAEIATLEKRLGNMGLAFKKLDDGTYGLCESCGNEINPGRLELIPEARHCIDCERRLRK